MSLQHIDQKQAMNKFKKSQILMLFGLISLLILTPLLSSSLRPTYLYFIFNLLIIALGAEAGLLSSFPKTSEEKKLQTESAPSKHAPTSETSAPNKGSVPESSSKKQKVIEKSNSEKIGGNVKMEPLKKCASTSSIFFIGEGEAEAEEEHGEVEEEVGNGQELYTQAETFIGNFYKQLKMQKEESWKNIHGFYQKGF